jgi:hypothetical protein
MGVGGQRHGPAALSPVKSPVSIVQDDALAPGQGCGEFLSHRDSIPGPSNP